MSYTPAQIIEKYLELRELKKAEKAAFTARELELNNMLEAMENHLLAVMNERGEKAIKTDKGTAFQAPQTRVQLTDRAALVDYVRRTGNFDFFTNAVSKETCVAFVEANKAAPPGVEISNSITVNVRKA
jgi:hypothetical protein